MSEVAFETKADRLVKLKELLTAELKSNDPSSAYIEDLKETIKRIEG